MPGQFDLRPAPLGAGVVAGFSTRTGGASAPPFDTLDLAANVGADPDLVRANRSAFAALVDAGSAVLCWAEQVHGAEVAVVVDAADAASRSGERGIASVDALVTAARGVLLCIRVADCLPVLFADPAAGVVGAAHAGRRGLAAGVLLNTVTAMESLGASRKNLHAVLGPSICGRCYEVPALLQAQFEAVVPGAAAMTRSGTPSLDLPAAARSLLERLDVAAIDSVDECTFERPDRWFSYRRSARTGRFAGYVGLS